MAAKPHRSLYKTYYNNYYCVYTYYAPDDFQGYSTVLFRRRRGVRNNNKKKKFNMYLPHRTGAIARVMTFPPSPYHSIPVTARPTLHPFVQTRLQNDRPTATRASSPNTEVQVFDFGLSTGPPDAPIGWAPILEILKSTLSASAYVQVFVFFSFLDHPNKWSTEMCFQWFIMYAQQYEVLRLIITIVIHHTKPVVVYFFLLYTISQDAYTVTPV